MKKLYAVFVIFIYIAQFINAQEQDEARQSFMFDSVMNIMRDKSIPLIDRYYMTGDIEHLTREHQVKVFEELVPEAKDFDDKAVITRLYSFISIFSADVSQYNKAEIYLDSALIYVDKTDNDMIKGVTFYNAARLYANQNRTEKSHDAYYKAAEFFKKKDPKLNILIDLYYSLSYMYSFRGDLESLKDLTEWMEDIPAAFPFQDIYKHTVKARSFFLLYKNSNDIANLDSVINYNHKSFELYLLPETPYDVGYVIADNHMLQAEVYYTLNRNDSAKIYLDKAAELSNPHNVWVQLQIRLLGNQLLVNEDNYAEVESGLNEGLLLLETLQDADNRHSKLLADYYEFLSQVQEKQGKMKEALASGKESLKYSLLLFDEDNSKYIQGLKAKYDLDNKQRSINQLIEINKMYERNRILYIGVGVLLLVTIVLIIFSFRRKQKIVRAKLKEANLISQLQQEKNETLTVKISENEQRYKLLLSENKLRQVNSYLEGLESERLRLSKELHDNIANNILSVNLQLRDKKDSETSEVSQQLRCIHEQVRNISHELIPPMFKYASFVEVLNDYVNQQNSHDKINISLSIDSEKEINKIPEKICLELYRIIQECISNTLKHSNASHIEILLYIKDNQLNMTIIDNGNGFDTENKRNGIGLIIIKERAKSFNGVVEINSTIGKGTEIDISVPLSKEVEIALM